MTIIVAKQKRIFKLISVEGDVDTDLDGKYTGRGPLQAARKAFNKYCSKVGLGECTKNFIIEEVGGNYKTFSYRGIRQKKEIPVKINGYEILYNIFVHKLS